MRGSATDISILNEQISLADLLAILEKCEVIGKAQPSTMVAAREAAIKAGDIALGKRLPDGK
jgi:hypothetical protein